MMVSTEKNPLIEARGITNKFGSHVVHDHLDFDIYPGEIVGVVGGNGTGKSVLLRTIVGLRRPNAGKVIIDGHDITKLSPEEMLSVQKLWSVLFQKGALFSNLTVLENVAFQLKERTNLPEDTINDIARMKIALTGLPAEAITKYPSELSGGMTKRASLARALALDPKVLFLDEPTAGLDSVAAEEFDTLIRELVDSLGISVFMITHDLDTLHAICDRIAVLVDKKIKTGTLEEHMKDDHPWVHEYFHNSRARFMTRERA